MRSTERLICLLKSVNADGIDNGDGQGIVKPGQHIAELCREAAEQLEQFNEAFKIRQTEIEEAIFGDHPGDNGC